MIQIIYRIALEADKHWGASKVEEQYRSSYIIKRFLADMDIDLYINLGDFFDTKLLLNSKSSIYAVRDFMDKAEICKARGIPVRAIRGTRSHDYDQWEIFNNYFQDPDANIRYFRTCTTEETLPGLNILYAPEENVNFAAYLNMYADTILDHPIQMGVFHGNFDKIMPPIAVRAIDNDSMSTTLVFRYEDLEEVIHGPMIAGHWHDGETYKHLTYVGSYDRWTFGEDELKGFVILEYDTEKEAYRLIKVPNILAAPYKTFECVTSIYKSIDDYQNLIAAVNEALANDPKIQLRVLVKVNELHEDTEEQVNNLKYVFANNRRVKLTIVNLIHQDQKVKKREENQEMETAYAYIRDKNLTIAEKLQRFIRQFTGHEYTVGEISNVIKPYVESL